MQRRYLTWIDGDGFTRLTIINSTAGSAAVQTAMLAQSQADVLNSTDMALTVNGAPAPAGGQYRAVSDVAALTYADASGNLVVLQLPAPSAALFLADTVTVNPAAIAALNAAVIGSVVTSPGLVVASYVGGTRRKGVVERYQN